MSAPELETSRTIDALIDRMVDGPLQPAELRAAMERLDATPDGWRRCALAFLEAQSWGDAMRPMNRHEDVESGLRLVPAPRDAGPEIPREHVQARPRWRPLAAGRALAAALIFLAFTLGWVGHGWRRPGTNEPPRSPAPASAPDRPVVEVVAESQAEPAPEGPRVEPVVDRSPRIQEVARLRIGTDAAHTAEVPILAGEGIDERWLLDQPSVVSEWQQVLWERQGYQLEQRRDLIPVTLADGRRAAVPVDQVQVRYVGHDPL